MRKLSAATRARKIKLLLFDVDGVLTDGKIYLFPVPSEDQHPIVVEAKGFSAYDGAGISLARLGGLKTGLITQRNSETVALRARDLKLKYVYQGITDKLTAFREIISKEGISLSAAAFVGDDVIDLPPI
jgi:3-deoxy-D-manno-octulosonate 8-phosphate phosphatase (KDO 8-P phosphatase)